MNRGNRSPSWSCGGSKSFSEEDDRNSKTIATSRNGWLWCSKKIRVFVYASSIAWPPNALMISHCVKQIPQGGFFQFLVLPLYAYVRHLPLSKYGYGSLRLWLGSRLPIDQACGEYGASGSHGKPQMLPFDVTYTTHQQGPRTSLHSCSSLNICFIWSNMYMST